MPVGLGSTEDEGERSECPWDLFEEEEEEEEEEVECLSDLYQQG
jgi:hypothetical protein